VTIQGVWWEKVVHTMTNRWLDSLKGEESKHNTAATLREGQNRHAVGPAAKLKTPLNRTDKTDKTSLHFLHTRQTPPDKTDKTPINPPSKTRKTTDADQLGLVSTWSGEFGHVSLRDPITGEWHDLQTKDSPGWSLWEARKRKELYKSGNRKAYRLTSSQMEEIWEAERSTIIEEGIVEEYPVEAEEA
jgi:hypothetical protein